MPNKTTAMAAIEAIVQAWVYGNKPVNQAFDEIARLVDETRAEVAQEPAAQSKARFYCDVCEELFSEDPGEHIESCHGEKVHGRDMVLDFGANHISEEEP